ncbi:MAG: zinc transporter [Rhodovulum sulfidophilum]|uniref:High-affinity zinc uptake system protein ZnuA n=1 Tax=Rhodovulum sulfidophilum TaxID=35806 RepID=A0A2W5NBC7_RHOSU|nr:MAG: zinc transporter [Rhodovulum sulfidophilum]
MPNSLRPAALAAAFLALAATSALVRPALAQPSPAQPAVVTDFGPVDSITARVMAGVGAPVQILPPGAEPHSYSLRPSEARELGAADLVVWVGPRMTPWLADPIAALASKAEVLTLDELPGLTLLPIRASGPFEADLHDHGAEAGEHDDHDHDAAGHDDPDHDAHADAAAQAAPDQHLWLDPDNATVFAAAIAAKLGAMDPAHAAAYAANAEAFAGEMAALSAEVDATLAPARGKPFIVFHDAYQYFEHRFDIPAAGSVALHDAESPGAARVAEIRDRVRADGVVCAFTEPQFPPKLLATITEGSEVRTAALDPEGVGLTPGVDLYPTLIRNLATDLAGCLR